MKVTKAQALAIINEAAAEMRTRLEPRVAELEKRAERQRQLRAVIRDIDALTNRVQKIEARRGIGASTNGHAKTGWDGLL